MGDEPSKNDLEISATELSMAPLTDTKASTGILAVGSPGATGASVLTVDLVLGKAPIIEKKKKKGGFDPNVKKQHFPNPRGFNNVNRTQAPKRYT